jgi:stress response protein YsnF
MMRAVRKEVRVRKDAGIEQETVSGQVRREDAEIEGQGVAKDIIERGA